METIVYGLFAVAGVVVLLAVLAAMFNKDKGRKGSYRGKKKSSLFSGKKKYKGKKSSGIW